MHDWIKVTCILCAFGVLREIRPSEPFVSEFLLGEWREITEEQLNRDVYPLGTYFYMALLVVVFLITDFLRFKPVIILSGLSGIAVYAILLWTTSLAWVQASQFFYGLYIATEIAYLTYIYAKVDPGKYPMVSSYTRIAALTGRTLSGISAQILTHYNLMNYRDLNYITFTAQILATLVAFLLPSMQYGIYFHRRNSTINAPMDKKHGSPDEKTFSGKFREASVLIASHARAAYTRPKVVAWSALYAGVLALFLQTQTYMQLLWKQINEETGVPVAYNGAVEATQTLLGAGGAFIAAYVARASLPAPAAAIQGVALFIATYFTNIYASYVGYIVVGMLFHYCITLASAKIASQLSDDSCFGLIFGLNTLIGTALQAILTAIIIQGLHLSIYAQYYVVSGLYMLLASGWAIGWMVQSCRQKQSANLGTI